MPIPGPHNYLWRRHRAGDNNTKTHPNKMQADEFPLLLLEFTIALFIAFIVISVLYMSGGLAAISLLAPTVAKVGAFSLLLFSLAISLTAAWYGAKYLFSCCANLSLFANNKNHPNEEGEIKLSETTLDLITHLGGPVTKNASPGKAPYQGESPLQSTNDTTSAIPGNNTNLSSSVSRL